MRRAIPILTALLAAQAVLAAVLHLGGERDRESGRGPLAAFERANVDEVRIATGDGSELRLERAGKGWRLPSADGFAADPSRIDRLLGQLESIGATLPIARSDAARERFRVAADQYERRIELIADGEPVAAVFFGESAGAGRVYARAEGADAIHEVEFALWQTTADVAKWLDRSVPAVERARIRQARLPSFRLRRDAGGGPWRIVDGGPLEDASADRASRLLGRLAEPKIKGVTKAEEPAGEPELVYSLTTDDGETVRFRYYRGNEDTAYLYRDGQPWRYEVAQSQLVALTEAAPKKLLASKPGAGGAAAQAGAGAGAGAGSS